MGQITIYLDDTTEKQINRIVKKIGLSKSKWIAKLIKEKACLEWPEHIASFAGTWKDFSTIENIRKNSGKDANREAL